jgi:pilus assembly protein Flp/PilA
MEMIMTKLFKSIARDRRGVSALEYGLMAALIAGALVTAVTNLSGNLQGLFEGLGTAISNNTPG